MSCSVLQRRAQALAILHGTLLPTLLSHLTLMARQTFQCLVIQTETNFHSVKTSTTAARLTFAACWISYRTTASAAIVRRAARPLPLGKQPSQHPRTTNDLWRPVKQTSRVIGRRSSRCHRLW